MKPSRFPLMVVVLTTMAVPISSCAVPQTSAHYAPPETAPPWANEIVLNATYDQVWEALIDHASSTFFAIDTFERDSGLMTLSFGASDVDRFIDCGYIAIWQGNSGTLFDGPYLEYIQGNFDNRLQGQMNIVVRPRGGFQTEVRVNARYVYTVTADSWTGSRPMVFSFDSNGTDTVAVDPRAQLGGSASQRTCQPTSVAENSVIEGIQAAL